MGQTKREERLMEDEVIRLTAELDRLVTLTITRCEMPRRDDRKIWGIWYGALGHIFPSEELARQHIMQRIRWEP